MSPRRPSDADTTLSLTADEAHLIRLLRRRRQYLPVYIAFLEAGMAQGKSIVLTRTTAGRKLGPRKKAAR